MAFRFATFTLDHERRQLLDGDREVHLSPKAYDLLTLFLQCRPRALSKADLHARLWPDTFVSDANLASLVAELRAALGEHGRGGQFIRTVHSFGYAFAAVATETETAPPNGAEAAGTAEWLARGDGRIPLRGGEQVVGRDTSADILLDSLSVSRHHARVSVAGARVTVEDLGSKNGTWVRGERLTQTTPIEDGDEIRFGSITVTFRSLLAPNATRTTKE
jgi:DNA-binding winged helix-turn-helix (wHTH) protein